MIKKYIYSHQSQKYPILCFNKWEVKIRMLLHEAQMSLHLRVTYESHLYQVILSISLNHFASIREVCKKGYGWLVKLDRRLVKPNARTLISFLSSKF